MSEAKPVRKLEEIQAEYGQLCAKAGDIQYKIKCFSLELDAVNASLQKVNHEAASLPKEEPKVVEAEVVQ